MVAVAVVVANDCRCQMGLHRKLFQSKKMVL
jgi:hypothetical protein